MNASLPDLAAIYCRISETDYEVDKIEIQDASLRKLAAQQGYRLVGETYADDGISAFSGDHRPSWEKLLVDLRARRFRVVLAVAEDRFSRDGRNLDLILTCVEVGAVWHTLRDGFVDPGDPNSEMMVGIRAIVSRREIRERSSRQRLRFDARRAAGLPLWGARPFGFELNRIDHRPDEASELRKAYETIAVGGTLYEIAQDWNSRGVRSAMLTDAIERLRVPLPRNATAQAVRKRADLEFKVERWARTGWRYTTINQLLRRPSNAARVSHSVRDGSRKTGKVEISDVTAAWEPIVNPALFDKVQEKLGLNATFKRVVDRRWLMTGLMDCGVCGAPMVSAGSSNEAHEASIYRCSSKLKPPLREADGRLAPSVRHVTVEARLVEPLVVRAIAEAFFFGPTAKSPVIDDEAALATTLRHRLIAIRTAAADMAELVGSPGFSVAALRRRGVALDRERSEIELKIEQLVRSSAHEAMLSDIRDELTSVWSPPTGRRVRMDVDRAADVRRRLELRFRSLPIGQQRMLVKALLDVTVNPGRGRNKVTVRHVSVPSLDEDLAEGGDPL